MSYELEFLDDSKISETADLWFEGWQEAHSALIPKELIKLRTRESFSDRLIQNMTEARIAVADGTVLGLCIVKKDELYQMYVSPDARGTGLAQTLIKDAEDRMRSSGHKTAWLACAIGNETARRFYEKSGWRNIGTESVDLDTSEGTFALDVWRFEKALD